MAESPISRRVVGEDTEEHEYRRRHLLIVDNKPEELSLLIGMLRAEDFRITLAFDGHQALLRAQVGQPDLILMEVTMPNLNGFGACRLLKADVATANIPIIFLTAASSLKDRLEGLRNGGVDYVTKPFDAEEVLARIHIHLRECVRHHAVTPPLSLPRLLDGDTQATRKEEWIVRAVVRYLQDNLIDSPSMETLAKRFGTYPKRLSTAFRAVLGKTIPEFLRSERLLEAERLLQHSSLSVTDIALELGFSSAANFSTAFRQHSGLTPGSFREQFRRSSHID